MIKHIHHLNFIIEETYDIMHSYNDNKMNRVPHAYIELLYRVGAASKGLKRLIEGIENEPELEFSAALIIRTMILDFFISLRGCDIKERALKEGKDDKVVKDDVELYINTILGDGLKLTANHFARMEKICIFPNTNYMKFSII